MIVGLHARWTKLLKSLNHDDMRKEFIYPEYGKQTSIEENIGLYAWHSNHHLAHIKQAVKYKGSFNT